VTREVPKVVKTENLWGITNSYDANLDKTDSPRSINDLKKCLIHYEDAPKQRFPSLTLDLG